MTGFLTTRLICNIVVAGRFQIKFTECQSVTFVTFFLCRIENKFYVLFQFEIYDYILLNRVFPFPFVRCWFKQTYSYKDSLLF